MPDSEKMITSKSPTINIATQRKLAEMKDINPLLTQEEANKILKVYLSALDRLLEENGETP